MDDGAGWVKMDKVGPIIRPLGGLKKQKNKLSSSRPSLRRHPTSPRFR